MLKLTVPGRELWDPLKEEFLEVKEQQLVLEHSLISLSKWESKWHKHFIGNENKSTKELLDYIRCMTVNQVKDDNIYNCLTEENIKEISSYINDPSTATWFNDSKKIKKNSREIITSELIYYMMIGYGIPVEFEKWPLNRLLTLIRICEEKNNPKKMSKREILNNNRMLNAKRRAKMGTRG